MVALWPGSQSYAVALLAAYAPQVALARIAGRLADAGEPTFLVLLSYLVRAVGVAGLLVAANVGTAVAASILLGAGMAMSGPARAHYEASGTAQLNQVLVSRLRVVDGLGYALVPALAGVVIGALGRDVAFDVSLAAYFLGAAIMPTLPRVGRSGSADGEKRATPPSPIARPVRAQIVAGGAIAGLSWMVNMLYVGYILVTLHAGPVLYGVAIGLWGVARLISAAVLPKIDLEQVSCAYVPRRRKRPVLASMSVCARIPAQAGTSQAS